MMRTIPSLRFLLASTLLLFCIGIASGEQTAPPTVQWMMYYYKNPQPERVPQEIREMSQAGMLKKEDRQSPFTAFFSQVMAQNPEKIVAWMTALDNLPKAEKEGLYLAIAYSHTAEGGKFLAAKGLKKYQGEFPEILEMEVNNADTLDMLWGYFMATGKAEPIRRIVSALNLSSYAGAVDKYKTSKKTEEDRKAAYLDGTFKVAAWSLRSNCEQHPRVREICEALLAGNSLNPVEHRLLGVLLKPQESAWREDGKRIEDKSNMKSKDGFGAQIFLTENSQFFEDWEKPEPPVLNRAEKAVRNVPLFTVLLFADPGLNADGGADVTADLKVLKPDGTVYGEKKDMVCWKANYTVPAHSLQLAREHMGIRIEPQDPSGVYTVEAVVHDKVKKIEIPLKVTFEVPK